MTNLGDLSQQGKKKKDVKFYNQMKGKTHLAMKMLDIIQEVIVAG